MERIAALVAARADVIAIDTAHGHSKGVIESVGIGITAPKNGFFPEYTATTDSSRYALNAETSSTVKNGIKWRGESGELAVSGVKFDNENDYIVSIKLVARDGYTFANSVTATINANNANVSVVSDTEIEVNYTFPKPEKAKWWVNFSNPGIYASGTMTPVQVDEGEYTLPDPEYVPYTNYKFAGWKINGTLKQAGDVITVTENTYLDACWQYDYQLPADGFTTQPTSKSKTPLGETAVAGSGIIKYIFNEDFVINNSVDYEFITIEFYDVKTGEWVTEFQGVIASYVAHNPTEITFSSSIAGEFTCRICAKKAVGGNKAISDSFTVTWAAKKFTTQPQGDVVDVDDTVTVTAIKNFYVEKYEIEYYDGEWKLYEEVSGGWEQFSYDFTSDVAKSVKFRLKAYAESDLYDEENECYPVILVDTSEEFTITWKGHEHIYGATPNRKNGNEHWKECTDPACPDKASSKIEVAPHKAIGGNCQTQAACACGEMLLGSHITNWVLESDGHFRKCVVQGCTYSTEKEAHADEDDNGKCDACGYQASVPTPDPDGSDNGSNGGNGDGKQEDNKQDDAGEPSVTEPVTDKNDTPDTPDETEKTGCAGSGCGSSMGVSAVALSIMAAAVGFAFKKKED